MNKCPTVHVPEGPGKRAAPNAQGRTEVRLAFRRTAVYMTMNRILLPSTPSARRGLTLHLLGLLVLLVGFGSAVFIWQAQDRIDRQARNAGTTDIAAAPLAAGDSRRETHDLELYYGETGLLMDKWGRWFEGLAHGKSLTKTIAVLSLVGASGCFFSARVAKAGQ